MECKNRELISASGNGPHARQGRVKRNFFRLTREPGNVITAKWKKMRGEGKNGTWKGIAHLFAIARVQVHNDKMQSPNGGNVPFLTNGPPLALIESVELATNGYPKFNETLRSWNWIDKFQG